MFRINKLFLKAVIASFFLFLLLALTSVFNLSYAQVSDCTGQPAGTWCWYYDSGQCSNGCYGGPDSFSGPPACTVSNNWWTCDGSGNCNTPGALHVHGTDPNCVACPPYEGSYRTYCANNNEWREEYDDGACNHADNHLSDCPTGCAGMTYPNCIAPPTNTPVPPTNTPVPPTPTTPIIIPPTLPPGVPTPTTPPAVPTPTTPPGVPTPTKVPCGGPCTSPSQCVIACPVCSTSGTCVAAPTSTPKPATPTPTPVLDCNSPCTVPASCTGAKNGCTYCNPTTKKCTLPPTPTPTLPPYSDDMCKCDGIELSSDTFAPGDKLTVTAYARVLAENSNYAIVKNMLFNSGKGSGNSFTRDDASMPIDRPVTLLPNTPGKVRYKSTWEYAVPSVLDPNLTYRIWAQPRCARKTAYNYSSNTYASISKGPNVLAVTTTPPTLWGMITNFFLSLFGVSQQQQSTSATPTATPVPDSSKRDTIQLDTLKFGKITLNDKCSIIEYKATASLE